MQSNNTKLKGKTIAPKRILIELSFDVKESSRWNEMTLWNVNYARKYVAPFSAKVFLYNICISFSLSITDLTTEKTRERKGKREGDWDEDEKPERFSRRFALFGAENIRLHSCGVWAFSTHSTHIHTHTTCTHTHTRWLHAYMQMVERLWSSYSFFLHGCRT